MMTLSDVMMDTKCFDLSRMSLSPSVINLKLCRTCVHSIQGVINGEVEHVSCAEGRPQPSITYILQCPEPKLLPCSAGVLNKL